MKKLLIVTALAATSTVASAFDYKFNVEGRADFVNANVKSTAQTTGVETSEKYNNFSNNLIRLNMMGTVNENLSYRFRYRFAKEAANPVSTNTSGTSGATTAREITNTTQVDYLYIDHKNSLFTTRFGKQNWNGFSYGREGIVSGTDVFLVSQAAANYKSAFGSDYRYGVTAMFKFMDTNTLDLAISNPNTTVTDITGTEVKNTGLAYGAFYTGSFMNKLVQPILAYQLAKQNSDADHTTPASRTQDVNYTMWNAGLRSEVAGAIIDADYKELKKPNRNTSATTTAANKEQKTKSIYANVAYAVGDFTPIATYINDKYTTEDNATAANANFKRNSFAVGTYWRPMSDVNFRYHLMVTNAVTKYEGTFATNTKVNDTKVYFGFKADI
ncbi:MAG: hypothetical protein PHY93_08860 [Bacteriovorax sp.]|nr:hypothetical protein [Bacteriovorax sp.]